MVEAYESMGYHTASSTALYGRSSQLMSGEAIVESGYAEGSAEQLFGAASTLGSAPDVDMWHPMLMSSAVYQILVLISFVAYVAMLWRSWSFASSMVIGMAGARDERRMAHEGGEQPLSYFKSMAVVIGIIIVALAGVRIADCFADPDSYLLTDSVVNYVPLGALLFVVVIIAWLYALHSIVGWITMSDVMSSIASISTMNFVRAVVLLYPIVAFWLVAPQNDFTVWTTIVVVGFALLLIIYLKDIFVFFLGKKIPFLYLILYLCGAILLPLSFLATILPAQIQ